MKLLFTSYSASPEYSDPLEWLERIEGYTGILDSLCKKHTVIAIERIRYKGERVRNSVHYFFIQQTGKRLRFPWHMHRLMRKIEPDVVFINGFIFPLQIIQLRLQLGRRIKLVVINRSEKPAQGARKYLQRIADTCVDAHLFSSLELGDEWVNRGNIGSRAKIHEVLHGSSIFNQAGAYSKKPGKETKQGPVFLWVGRLDANKDPLTVVRAFILFLEQQPAATLLMIYASTELLEEIRMLIRENSNASRAIQLLGKIPHRLLEPWFQRADFIISASHYEGGGIAVCEAMSCGCIPIVTDITAFRKMTGPGKCGLLYEAGNERALLHAMQQAMVLDIDQERNKVIGQFRTELSFDAIAEKINRVIQL